MNSAKTEAKANIKTMQKRGWKNGEITDVLGDNPKKSAAYKWIDNSLRNIQRMLKMKSASVIDHPHSSMRKIIILFMH